MSTPDWASMSGWHLGYHVSNYRRRCADRVAILCGGTTAGEQDLSRVACPILGVNESWRAMPYPRTFAHVLSDIAGAAAYGADVVRRWPEMPVFQKVWAHGKMLIPGAIPIKVGPARFSVDLAAGAWAMCAPVLALELAAYMGFSEIVMIGLDHKDRGGKLHWWDEAPDHPRREQARRDWAVQAEALRACASVLRSQAVRVVNVSHDTTCDAFERAKFDEVFA